MTFTELLRAGNLPKATLHRILATLMREGLLRHDNYSKTYQLGFRLLELANEVWSDFDMRLELFPLLIGTCFPARAHGLKLRTRGEKK